MAADNSDNNGNSDGENNYFSDSAYDSDKEEEREVNIKYNNEMLCFIFKIDNVSMLKKALKHMTPKEIYNNIRKSCFCYIDTERNGDEKHDPHDSIKCFKYLIKRGLDINEKDEDGNTPLHYACIYNVRAIYYLLRNGADPNAISDCNGFTPVQNYIYYHNDEKVSPFLKEAIKYGFKINAINEEGENILSLARSIILNGKLETLKDLLNFFIVNGIDINHQDNEGRTFIHGCYVNEKDVENFVKIMVDRGFDFGIENKEGVSVINSIRFFGGRERRTMTEKELNEIIRDKIVKIIEDLQFIDVKGALE